MSGFFSSSTRAPHGGCSVRADEQTNSVWLPLMRYWTGQLPQVVRQGLKAAVVKVIFDPKDARFSVAANVRGEEVTVVCTEGGDTVEAVKVPLRGMTGYNMRDVRNYIRVEEPTVSMCDGPTFKDAGAAGQCTCTGVCLCWNGRCWDGWARRRVCVPSRALHAPWDAWGERAAQRAQPRSLLNRALPRRVAAAVCPPPCAGCTEVVVVPYEETHNVVFAFEPDMPCSAASSAEAKEAMRGALVPTPEGIKATNAVAVTAACRNGQADNATLVLKGVTKAQARKRPPPPTPLYMVLKRREHGRGVARPARAAPTPRSRME